MINLLLGPPGGGKTYEAVVYHVLPALASGRKVITNLPLNLDRLREIDATYPGLVQKVEDRLGMVSVRTAAAGRYRRLGAGAEVQQEGVVRAFSTMADYGDTWRHPVDGSGPLYVIDECHLALPYRQTQLAVEEWFSMIRHESADALLITQSYGKVSRTIVDLVQVCYRVRKATAFGSAGRYIRKVQDGVRGDVVNEAIRKYEAKNFSLYQSHTKGGGAELVPGDIVPIWKRWPFIGAAVILPLGAVMFFSTPSVLKPPVQAPAAPIAAAPGAAGVSSISPESAQPVAESKAKKGQVERWDASGGHPLTGRTLHVVGRLEGFGRRVYEFVVAQNGQTVMTITSGELVGLGYSVDIARGEPCAVQVGFDDWRSWVICDAPTVGVGIPGTARAGSGGGGVTVERQIEPAKEEPVQAQEGPGVGVIPAEKGSMRKA
jgi:zona occludens toxin